MPLDALVRADGVDGVRRRAAGSDATAGDHGPQ